MNLPGKKGYNKSLTAIAENIFKGLFTLP